MRVHILYLGSHDAIRVHKAGCRDVARELRTRAVTSDYQVDVDSQRGAAEDFWSDFIAEDSMTADQAWSYTTVLPCAAGLPERTQQSSEGMG